MKSPPADCSLNHRQRNYHLFKPLPETLALFCIISITKHKLKSRPGPLSSSTVVTPHLTLPKLLRGTWDRWVAQVSFITIYSLGPAALATYPHRPSQAGGYPWDCALLPPFPLSRGEPVRAAAAYLGVRTDEVREKETEGWGVTEKRGEKKINKKSRSGSRTHCRSVHNQLSGSVAVPCDGTGHLWWTARCSSASWRTAMAPPVEGSRQRVPRYLLLPKHGGWQQASASRRTGPTPPLPLGWQPPLLDPGARQRVFRPTCSSFTPAPPLRAATGGLRYLLLPDLLSTVIPLSSEGSLTACPSFLPGFGHQCNTVRKYGKKEAGTGEHLTTLIIK